MASARPANEALKIGLWHRIVAQRRIMEQNRFWQEMKYLELRSPMKMSLSSSMGLFILPSFVCKTPKVAGLKLASDVQPSVSLLQRILDMNYTSVAQTRRRKTCDVTVS